MATPPESEPARCWTSSPGPTSYETWTKASLSPAWPTTCTASPSVTTWTTSLALKMERSTSTVTDGSSFEAEHRDRPPTASCSVTGQVTKFRMRTSKPVPPTESYTTSSLHQEQAA